MVEKYKNHLYDIVYIKNTPHGNETVHTILVNVEVNWLCQAG